MRPGKTQLPLIWSILLILYLLPGFSTAQQIFSVSYDVSIPSGTTREFISTSSPVGFGLEAQKMLDRHMTFGISFHWNMFSSDQTQWISDQSNPAARVTNRSMDSFPVQVGLHYYLFEDADDFRPYFGVNGGTFFIIQRQIVDGLKMTKKNWHLGVSPDFGFLLKFRYDIYFTVTARYYYAFKKPGETAQTYWSVLLGLASISIF